MNETIHFFFLSTQARILISEWKELAKCIISHSTPLHEKPITNLEELENFDIENLENITLGTSSEDTHILSEKQITVALQGPFGAFLNQKIASYAKVARFRLEIHLKSEELFKGKRTTLAAEDQISEKQLKKITFSELTATQKQLEDLVVEHENEWLEFIKNWTETLIEYFKSSNLPLTDREIKDLYDENLATEILPRFSDLSMQLPKKKYPTMAFIDYLILKSHLAIQSSLSRRHLSHEELDILDILRNFKPQFELMKQQEEALLSSQKALTEEVVKFLE